MIANYDFKEMEAMKYYSVPSTWSEEKKQKNAYEKILSGEWFGAYKFDGFFGKFVKNDDGSIGIYTRSRNKEGQFINKVDYLPHLSKFFADLPNGTCLLGEMYLPSQPGSKKVQTILGCLVDKALDRQKSGEKICFYVFDILAWDGESYLKKPAAERFDKLNIIRDGYGYHPYVLFAEYLRGEELWNTLQAYLAAGGEGMVITKSNATYQPGQRPSTTTLKVKQELKNTIDCVIIGKNEPTREYNGAYIDDWEYWEDGIAVTKAYYNHWAGSFKLGLYRDGELVYFGDLSGLTDEMKSDWESYVGQVAEISAMQLDDVTGHCRHPRLISIRTDKAPEECTWEQVKANS